MCCHGQVVVKHALSGLERWTIGLSMYDCPLRAVSCRRAAEREAGERDGRGIRASAVADEHAKRITHAGQDRTKVSLWKLVPVERGDLAEKQFAKLLVTGDAAGTLPSRVFLQNPPHVFPDGTAAELRAELPAVPAPGGLSCENVPGDLAEVPAADDGPAPVPDADKTACLACHLPFTATTTVIASGRGVVASKLAYGLCAACALVV